jgi:hypothetical protein
MTSPNDVITSNLLLIWKAHIKTFHMMYYTVWLLMVPSITKFDIGVSKFRPAARSMKVMAHRPQKLFSWVAANMLLSHQVWSWSDKSYSKIGFCWQPTSTITWPWPLTLTFKWCHQWSSRHSLTTIQEILYRCEVYWTRKSWVKMIA